MTKEEFLAEFGARTAAYLGAVELDTRPVTVSVGEGAHSRAGHLLLVSLVNQLARAHSALRIIGDLDRPLEVPSPFGHGTLAEATVGLAREINPFIEIAGEEDGSPELIRLAVGHRESGALALGAEGWCATFGAGRIWQGDANLWGAALASCIAAAGAFGAMCGRPFEPAPSYSLWDGAAGTGQGTPRVPLELGSVLQVGAGAVGAALDWWLACLGVADLGEWTIVDGDVVEVSNLNRQLLYRASDAGWPDGAPASKARRSAELIGALPSEGMWGRDAAVAEANYDLVLALADEDGVRSLLQLRQPPVLLHATTSVNWQAQSHRHIRSRDDCILCRLPGPAARTDCATGAIEEAGGESAALPFLSATAGLLLAADLARLGAGALAEDPLNFRALDFNGASPVFQQAGFSCRPGCATWLPADARRTIAADTRFAGLDPG
jgi:molybdopterin-synthase adenylyltransferase